SRSRVELPASIVSVSSLTCLSRASIRLTAYARAVSTYQWLIALHVSGAFLLLGGSIVAATFAVLARRRERPSEIALFYGLIRVGEVAIYAGALLTIVIGLWLVHEADYGYGEFWVWASVLLWILGNALGGIGGKR